MTKIIDTTLREGEQAPGIFFSFPAKKRILTGLTELSIDEIEIGIACPDNTEIVALSHFIHDTHPEQRFSLWCRCNEDDIRFASTLNPSCLALSIPASDLHLEKKLAKNRDWAIKHLQHSINLAFASGIRQVAVGLEDATRADIDFVKQLATIARDCGAFRLRLADTVGIATPDKMARLVSDLAESQIEIGVHCHNDFGMATANTINGLEHGATWGDATILGIGERAGNCRLEEVLSFLVLQKDFRSYRLSKLRELSQFTAQQAGLSISPSQPIIGNNLFSCETGLHLQGLMTDPATYEPFDPALVGLHRKLLIGRQAGKNCVEATIKRLGLPHPDQQTLRLLTQQIRDLAKRHKRPLDDHEIVQIVESHLLKPARATTSLYLETTDSPCL